MSAAGITLEVNETLSPGFALEAVSVSPVPAPVTGTFADTSCLAQSLAERSGTSRWQAGRPGVVSAQAGSSFRTSRDP